MSFSSFDPASVRLLEVLPKDDALFDLVASVVFDCRSHAEFVKKIRPVSKMRELDPKSSLYSALDEFFTSASRNVIDRRRADFLELMIGKAGPDKCGGSVDKHTRCLVLFDGKAVYDSTHNVDLAFCLDGACAELYECKVDVHNYLVPFKQRTLKKLQYLSELKSFLETKGYPTRVVIATLRRDGRSYAPILRKHGFHRIEVMDSQTIKKMFLRAC